MKKRETKKTYLFKTNIKIKSSQNFLLIGFFMLMFVLSISMNLMAQADRATLKTLAENGTIKNVVKTIQWNVSQVCLTEVLNENPSSNSIYSNFYILTDYSESNIQIKRLMPPGYKVTDFEIMSNTIYCCGYQTNDGITEQKGFIAYINLLDLMSNAGELNLSKIPLSHSVRKIQVFKDADIVNIVGIGEMEYGHFLLPPCFGCPPSYSPIENYDFMVSYQVTEHTIEQDRLPLLCNKFQIFRCLNTNDIEKFQDIITCDSYIGIASLKYDLNPRYRIYAPNGEELSRKVYWRTLNKSIYTENDNYFEIRWRDGGTGGYYQENFLKGVYDLKLKDLNYSRGSTPFFAMSYVHYDSYDGLYANIANKMGYNNVYHTFCYLSTRVNESNNGNIRKVWDMEYFKTKGKLLLLKQDSENKDAVYELDFSLERNDFNSLYPPYTYYSNKLQSNDPYVSYSWRSLNHFTYDNDPINHPYDYKVLGLRAVAQYPGSLLVLDNNNGTTSDCKTNINYQVQSKPYPVDISPVGYDHLVGCNWDLIAGLSLIVPIPNVTINKYRLQPREIIPYRHLCNDIQ